MRVLGREGAHARTLGSFLCESCAGIPVVWVRDVGYVTVHWEDHGRIPSQGGPQTDGTSTTYGAGWHLGVTSTGVGDGRGRPILVGDLFIPPPEHSLTVHRDQGHYGTVSFGRDTPRDKGVQLVVGEGGPILGGEPDGGS